MENLETYLKKINEENWRNICNSVVYVRCPQKLDLLKKAGFEVDPRNDGFLAMCFIEHNEGVSFYIISPAHIRNENIFVSRENKSSSLIFRAKDLSECFYLNQDFIQIDLTRYYSYADALKKEYETGIDDIMDSRDLEELDEFREPFFPDDVQILLVGKTFGQEKQIVRIQRFGENCLYGILLNEPSKATGLHKGDEVDFMFVEREGGLSTIHIVK